MAVRSAILALYFLALAAGAAAGQQEQQQQQPDAYARDAQAASAFCRSAQASAAGCGWASSAELSKTASAQGLFGGTAWRGEPAPLPLQIEQTRPYYQWAGHAVSLACRPGRVVVRTVFKALDGGAGCSRLDPSPAPSSVWRDVTAVQRCDLQLPAHGAADEAAAALRSKEVNCRPCANCASCPQPAAGRWYSDTFYAAFDGCDALAKGAPYKPATPAVLLNPGAKVLLAKFEVQAA